MVDRSFDDVKREASECIQCQTVSNATAISLVAGRTQVVFGVGPLDARLMFIGEAPGKDEDREGKPFVGRHPRQAGTVLDERLAAIDVPRDEVYITNLVKCRPTKFQSGRAPVNRRPSGDEIRACTAWLEHELKLVDPKLIVSLGVPATTGVLGRKVTMKHLHGRLIEGEGPVWGGRLIIPTYHPTGIRGDAEKRRAFVEDFDKIRSVYNSL
jgi:uracil-DNA glycosylase family 4